MRFRGFVKGSGDAPPIELEELTLAGEAAELRQVARFLLWAATEMDKHGEAFGHEHLKDHDSDWASDADLIALRYKQP